MCGDDKPVITAGYANWSVVARPLQTGVTTFQGYDPTTMDISLRFGTWKRGGFQTGARAVDPFLPQWNPSSAGSGGYGWDTSPSAARQVESDIQVLEWMAGAHQGAGMPPYVYVNSYDSAGFTSDLIPRGYQSVGTDGGILHPDQWVWIIDGGIKWGPSWSIGETGFGTAVQRVYQECTLTLRNYMNFNSPPSVRKQGTYFKVTSAFNTCKTIAAAPSITTTNPNALASMIRTHPKNNPIRNTNFQLQRKSISAIIPNGYDVWIPQHTI